MALRPDVPATKTKKTIAPTEKDLEENPAMRCPCMFVLDTSTSMDGDPIKELNAGVQAFIADIKGDPIARDSVELGVIAFHTDAEEILTFCSIDEAEVPELHADGATSMGAAVRLAIKRLRDRREQYKKIGGSSYVPWLILMTDGEPTDNWQGAAAELKSLGEQNKIVIFAVGIGNNCDFDTLSKFCPHTRPPIRLQGYDFKKFFAFMSKSLEQVTASGNAAAGIAVMPPASGPAPPR